MKPTQADSEIEEEHLLNFVVNSLDEELAIDLGDTGGCKYVKIRTKNSERELLWSGKWETDE